LKDHADVLTNHPGCTLWRDLFAIEKNLAAFVGCQQVDAAQQGAFACAAWADNHNGLAFIDLEIDILEDNILAVNLSGKVSRMGLLMCFSLLWVSGEFCSFG
jgi:hypothetical protein